MNGLPDRPEVARPCNVQDLADDEEAREQWVDDVIRRWDYLSAVERAAWEVFNDSGDPKDLDDVIECIQERASFAGFWCVSKTEAGRN